MLIRNILKIQLLASSWLVGWSGQVTVLTTRNTAKTAEFKYMYLLLKLLSFIQTSSPSAVV